MSNKKDISQPRTKLQRLEMLQKVLLECREESVHDEKEYNIYNFISSILYDEIERERRSLGYMGVYPIINGCSGDCLFEGTKESCQIYVSIMREANPDVELMILHI